MLSVSAVNKQELSNAVTMDQAPDQQPVANLPHARQGLPHAYGMLCHHSAVQPADVLAWSLASVRHGGPSFAAHLNTLSCQDLYWKFLVETSSMPLTFQAVV